MSSRRSLLVLTMVLAMAAAGCGSDSPTANEPAQKLGPPSGVTATPEVGSVTVTWAARAGATGYTVFWDTLGQVDAADSTVEVSSSPFVHGGLTNGTTYHYRVASRNGAGLGDLSGQVSAKPNPAVGVRLIACGYSTSYLVNSEGYLYAWGANDDGQLGQGSWSYQYTPTSVPGVSDVVAVSGGQRHTLVLTGNGQVYAMGYNTNGQLGVGDNQPRWWATPVSGLTNIVSIAAGRLHSVACTADGEVYVWGDNTSGRLGVGEEGGSVYEPTLVYTDFFHHGGFVAAGNGCSFFKANNGNPEDTALVSWGNNSAGQLGRDLDNYDAWNIPAYVNNTVTITAASIRHMHILALSPGGDPVSWGLNSDGQLGDGSTTQRAAPVNVNLVEHVQAVATGVFFSLALGEDGRIMCWGANYSGQLGDGTHNSTPTRTWVNDLTNITMIAAGEAHSLALRADGTVWSWGRNTDGQLGDGNVVDRSEPARVVGY
jgi:alpha-tubulin suppressor-like RCC1 family protein